MSFLYLYGKGTLLGKGFKRIHATDNINFCSAPKGNDVMCNLQHKMYSHALKCFVISRLLPCFGDVYISGYNKNALARNYLLLPIV